MEIMKIVSVIALYLACVKARGSGPYLPSGWKPDGPSFNLPFEVSKTLNKPLKEVIFTESEASGSDFLREYGPPKIQDVSQDISQQGLPDIVNGQLFVDSVVKSNGTKEDFNVVADVSEQKLEVNIEVKEDEEVLAGIQSTTEATGSEPNTNTEGGTTQVDYEISTSANIVIPVEAGNEFGNIVEPTVTIVVPTEKIIIDAIVQSENQILSEAIVETQKLTNQQQESSQTTQAEELTLTDTIQNTSESNSIVSEQAELSSIESSETNVRHQVDINLDVISTVEKRIESIAEEVKSIEKVVQNIPELIVNLENDNKTQQAETTQQEPVVVQENLGTLEQIPEGFLEYGPPGFTEYGPPKEDLSDNNIEEIPEAQSIENTATRKHRFSPKFKSSLKSH